MLAHCADNPQDFEGLARDLFGAMKGGGRIGFERVEWFNGGLFDSDHSLPLEKQDIADLQAAAKLDWSDIDPSILGTLFERGLDPDKRSQLGAHYTDRDKIMQIINPVIVEPLLAEFEPKAGQPVWLGLDLSQNRDLTALAAVQRNGEKNGKPCFDAWVEVWTPGEAAPTPDLACDGELAQLGLSYIAAENPMEHPAGRPDLTCDVEGAIRLSSPVRGVTYASSFSGAASPMFMRCELAVALAALADYLSELDIVRVAHMGTYNCRTIAGSDSLSMHGLGLAIDIAGFVDAQGVEYSVLNDWEDGVDSPVTDKGRLLYEVAHQMLERGVFNIVLTPEFNAAHDNHFHVDLTPGADFIGFGPSPLPVVGTNPSGE
jgi:hypothetical protein